MAGHGLGGLHVDSVDVRSLLPVHLDRHKLIVDQLCNVGVLEGLVGHDVAPVACGIADGEKDWDVAGGGLGKGLVAPRPPVHRIVRMLQQIGTGGGGQAIATAHHTTLCGWGPRSWAGRILTARKPKTALSVRWRRPSRCLESLPLPVDSAPENRRR